MAPGGNIHATVTDAVDHVVDGDLIGMFTSTHENVVIGAPGSPSAGKSFTIIQCAQARIDASPPANPNLPALHIASAAGAVIISGLDLVNASGAEGVLVDGSQGDLKGLRVNNNRIGALIGGTGNRISFNSTQGNQTGVQLTGTQCDVRGTVDNNVGNGIEIIGPDNSVRGAMISGNGGWGIDVRSSDNSITSGHFDANGKGGIRVAPLASRILISAVGATGNTGSGFRIEGTSNTLEFNKATANRAGGFAIVGTSNALRNNVSGGGTREDNQGCEYLVTQRSNSNLGGNRANGVTVPGTLFPAGCTGTP
jgi:hypothetical protein